MSIVAFRSFSTLRHGRTAILKQCYKFDEVQAEFTCHTVRHYHISLTRRLNPTRSLKYVFLNSRTVPHKRAGSISFPSAKFASTFVIETPGKLSKSVENPPSSPSVQHPVTSSITDPIPDPPTVPVESVINIVDVSDNVTKLAEIGGEPSFASLGLGGWSPVGIVENCMEFLHVDCGLPWWSAIVIGTLVVRTVLFPVVIISQRNAAKMNNYLPQMQFLQLKMSEARQSGDQIEAARYAQEMMKFMKEKDLNPLKNMIVPIMQAPIFISFFMALRGMANTPVPSFQTGGFLWFQDLTMPDQYFLLPLITSATLWLTIELGTDATRASATNAFIMKYVLRAIPIVIFPFTMNFPGAVLCYWVSSNFVSLLQVGFLRLPKVRNYFKIEPLVNHDPQTLPVKPKPFVEGFKESWTNMKITRQMEERGRFDEMQFRRAGNAPLQKTFKYDPTQVRGAVSAKKRTDP